MHVLGLKHFQNILKIYGFVSFVMEFSTYVYNNVQHVKFVKPPLCENSPYFSSEHLQGNFGQNFHYGNEKKKKLSSDTQIWIFMRWSKGWDSDTSLENN